MRPCPCCLASQARTRRYNGIFMCEVIWLNSVSHHKSMNSRRASSSLVLLAVESPPLSKALGEEKGLPSWLCASVSPGPAVCNTHVLTIPDASYSLPPGSGRDWNVVQGLSTVESWLSPLSLLKCVSCSKYVNSSDQLSLNLLQRSFQSWVTGRFILVSLSRLNL